jgi:excisionase family DNA binding protein
MNRQPESPPEYLTPAAVAAIFYVDPKTVTRWATAGKLTAIRTPGGHRRFVRSEVLALVDLVHADASHLPVPGLAEAAPGTPAASAAAVMAEAAAVALEAEADVAVEMVARTASLLADATTEATRAASEAHQARLLATVHAAYADSVANGSASPRDSSHRLPDPWTTPPDHLIPQQRTALGPRLAAQSLLEEDQRFEGGL